jgi:alpha-tubulin suppressor-like RCC1 family protein
MKRFVKPFLKITTFGLLVLSALLVTISPTAHAAAAPTISSISPATGYAQGGDSTTITGTGFDSGAAVKFGNTPAASVTFVNSTTLTAITPVETLGQKDVTVTNSDTQSAVLVNGFTYVEAAPAIGTISPNVGPAVGGKTVTITGSGFSNGLKKITQVSTSTSANGFSCGLYNTNQAYCWGYNGFGQLGNNSTGQSNIPVAVNTAGVLAGKTVRQLSVGDSHACAIASDGNGYCWGRNESGQLGKVVANQSIIPVAVDISGALAGKTLLAISASSGTTCAIASDGNGYCWGLGTSGQLGNNALLNSTAPVAVDTTGVLAGKTLTSISVGDTNVCAVASDGNAYCWGANANKLGNNSGTASKVPVAVTNTGALAGKTIKKLSTGFLNTCVIASDNLVYCWGSNASGQMGSAASGTVPAAVDATGVLAGKTILDVSVGTSHACVIASDGNSYCWGNPGGALGYNSSTLSAVPVATQTSGVLAGKTLLSIDSGYQRTCAIASDYQKYCWGSNSSDPFGNTAGTSTIIPVSTTAIQSANPTVSFGTTTAASTLVSSSQLTVTSPAHAAGIVDVSVKNYDNQSGTATNAYEFVTGPAISAISANFGDMAGGNTVTVTGNHFYDGMSLKIGGVTATNIVVTSQTTLTATVPAGSAPGAVDVTVVDEFSQTATLTGGYTYKLPTPTISSVSPNISAMDSAATITITGTNFVAKPVSGTYYSVQFGGTAATNVTFINTTTLTATLPSHSLGTYDVTVTSSFSATATLTNGFTYTASNYAFTNAALNISTGQAGKLTITQRNASNLPITSNVDTTVTLSSSSANGKFARDLSENISTRWSYTTVVIPAGSSSVDVWYMDTTKGTPTITGAVTGSPNFTQSETVTSPIRLQVTGVSNPIKSGNPSSVTVRVVDYLGSPQTGYTGTIHFSSTDGAAQLPAQYTMTADDHGIRTFTNGVVMHTQGTFCVSATDTLDSVITGSQCGIVVQAPNAGTITKFAITTPAQFLTAGASSNPISIQSQASDGTAVPVASDTPVYLYTDSGTGSFSTDSTTWSSSPFTATLPAGSSTINVYYKDSAQRTSKISARDSVSDTADGTTGDFGWTNATQNIVTGLGAATKTTITGSASLLTNAKGMYTVQLQDAGGNQLTAPSDITIQLATITSSARFYLPTDPSTALTSPQTITIPAGSTSTTYLLNDSVASSGTTFTHVTASDARVSPSNPLSQSSFDTQIIDDVASKTVITPSNASTAAGTPLAVDVKLQTSTSAQAYATATTAVNLNATNSGQFSLTASPFTPLTTFNFAQGEGVKTLYFRSTLAGTSQLGATVSGLTTIQSPVTVTAFTPVRYALTPSSTSVPINTPSSAFTVTSYDTYGNIAIQSSDTPVYLYSSVGTTSFATSSSGPWNKTLVTMLSGQSSVQFYMQDSAFHGSAITITASDSATLDQPDTGIINGTSAVTISSQPIATIEITTPTRTIQAGGVTNAISFNLKKADGSAAIQDGATSIQLLVGTGNFVATQSASASAIGAISPAQGASSATVYYTSQTTGTFTMTIRLASNASINTTQDVTVTQQAPSVIVFTSTPQTINIATPSAPITVVFKDSFGNPSPLQANDTLTLTSTCGTGAFSETSSPWSPTTTISLLSGASSATFYYKDTTGGSCTIGAGSTTMPAATQAMTINAVAPIPTTIRISGSTADLVKGTDRNFTVDLLDQFGNVTPATSATTVYFASTSGSGTFNANGVVFGIGESTKTMRYNDPQASAVTLTAKDQQSAIDDPQTMVDDTIAFNVIDGTASKTSLSPATATLHANEVQALTVTLQNANSLPVNAASATVISLNSTDISGTFYSDPGKAHVVTTITVPQGSSSATFYYSQTQSGSPHTSISGSGLAGSTAILTVLPYGSIDHMAFTSSPHTGGAALEKTEAGTFVVTLYDAFNNIAPTPSTLTLYIASNNGGTVSGSGQIIIPAGQSSGTFTYSRAAAGSVVLTATDAPSGSPSGVLAPITQNVDIVEGAPANIIFSTTNVPLERGGVSSAVTASLVNAHGAIVAAGSGGQAITLLMAIGTGTFSDAPNGSFTASPTLTIPEGQTSVDFYYRNDSGNVETRNCGAVDLNGNRTCTTTGTATHTIRARSVFSGSTRSTDLPVTLSYGAAVKLVMTTPAREVNAYEPSSVITVERQNQYGKPVASHDNLKLNLRSSATGGNSFGNSKTSWGVSSVTILDSAASADFYYKDSAAGTPTLTAADTLPLNPDINLVNATQPITVFPATGIERTPFSFLVTNVSDPQSQGTHSSLVVIALDEFGYVVDTYAGTVSFTSSDLGALLPQTYTFDPGTDKGEHTFTNQVAFPSTGEKTVTAADTNGITGSQTDITVTGGNTNPLAGVAFVAPPQPITLSKGLSSGPITVELQDSTGTPTLAGVGGQPLHLTTPSATGQFATSPGGPWFNQITITVPQGITFTNVYYRNSVIGASVIRASDWTGGIDSGSITNGQANIITQSIGITSNSLVQSVNAFGNLEESHYLFARDEAGLISGVVSNQFSAYDKATHAATDADWQTEWKQGSTTLQTDTASSANQVSQTLPNVMTTAGASDFTAVAKATDSTFSNPSEVVTQEITVPVSPWKSMISEPSTVAENQDATITVQYANNSAPDSPSVAAVYLLPESATSIDDAVDSWAGSDVASQIAYVAPANTLTKGDSYRLLSVTYDSDGFTTSQSLSGLIHYAPNSLPPITPLEPITGGNNTRIGTGSSPQDVVVLNPHTPDTDNIGGGGIVVKPTGPETPLSTIVSFIQGHLDVAIVTSAGIALVPTLWFLIAYRQKKKTSPQEANKK